MYPISKRREELPLPINSSQPKINSPNVLSIDIVWENVDLKEGLRREVEEEKKKGKR